MLFVDQSGIVGDGLVVVVVLTQPPGDEPQYHMSCMWKEDKLITVGAWV